MDRATDLLTEVAGLSKGEMRKTAQAGGVGINKEKLSSHEAIIASTDLLAGRYIIAQRGKKNYFLKLIAR